MSGKTKKKEEAKSLKRRAGTGAVGPWEEMERFFDEFGRRGWLHPFSRELPMWSREDLAPFAGRMPKVDMVDREGALVISAELPGVRKDDVDVTLDENTVTIAAHTSHENNEEKEGKYYRHEMSRGDFQRTLTLPCSVDGAKAKASFSDGVLELRLPKTEKSGGTKVKVD